MNNLLDLSGRFEIRGQVGSGGMGIVYEAYDRERRAVVALKTVLQADPAALSRLKKEFRTLSDLTHPNLVMLYELIVDHERCFFTMEFVNGSSFLQYVRPSGVLDLSRLQRLFAQLIDGVRTLHGAGIVHRDLKPSNLMVTPEGRLVILDFGLATQSMHAETAATIRTQLAGTIAYMAPEQLDGDPPSSASDWYSIGVILYEALTGQLPYSGTMYQILAAKQKADPVNVRQINPDAPERLAELTLALMQRDPTMRPGGDEVLALWDPALVKSAETMFTGPNRTFVGREANLLTLDGALALASRGRQVSVYVYGKSGIGKTALVTHFLEKIQPLGVLVLSGRCYERELIPYKAFDGIVDNLARYLSALDEDIAAKFVPDDAWALARSFPTLLQVYSIRASSRNTEPIRDPIALRQRAFSSLRDLFRRVAKDKAVVIYIDDLQWTDADSIVLLEEIFRPPAAPPLMLIISFRQEDVESKPFLKSMCSSINGEDRLGISLNPLERFEVLELATSMLRIGKRNDASVLSMITQESAGNPFLVEELARYAAYIDDSTKTEVSFSEMLQARLKVLPTETRRFLDTLAVAGRPMDIEVVSTAAHIAASGPSLVASLGKAHFLRTSGTAGKIELHHDRLRETLLELLEAQSLIDIHSNLALALVAHNVDDPEALFEHYLRSNDKRTASEYARKAAQKAMRALAFDRAAVFYRQLLDMQMIGSSDLSTVKAEFAHALMNAGRTAEAADAYMDAATIATPADSLEFHRRAAEQLLMGGHIDAGMDVLRKVLAEVGLKLAVNPKVALMSLLMRRLHLRLRGLHFTERDAAQIPPGTVLLIDTCWAVAIGLAMVDNIRGADFQTRHLLLALRAGEPYRIARAFAAEAGFSATVGRTGRTRSIQFRDYAERLAEKIDNPHATGLTMVMAGAAASLFGEWRNSAKLSSNAATILRDRCIGVTWELTTAQIFLMGSLMYLGELSQLARERSDLLAAAKERGNLYLETELHTRYNVIWLAQDNPDTADDEVSDALQRWSHKGFHRQHYNALLARTQADLYRQNGEKAWKRINQEWESLARALLLRIQLLRVEAMWLRARAALTFAEQSSSNRGALLRTARRIALQIEKEHMAWCAPLGVVTLAAIASMSGEADHAVNLLADAIAGFRAADMELHRVAAEYCRGNLIRGDEGRKLLSDSENWMRKQGIESPVRFTQMLMPGFGS